jgi:cytochrome c-type biogenesis protein CcmH
MRILKIFFLTLIFVVSVEAKSSEKNIDLKNKILKNIRCLICQGQSIYDSESDFASSIKLVVEKKIHDGITETQIYEYLKEKYGEWILYEPELSKNTYILWLLPILLFLFGGAIIYRNIIIKKKY